MNLVSLSVSLCLYFKHTIKERFAYKTHCIASFAVLQLEAV